MLRALSSSSNMRSASSLLPLKMVRVFWSSWTWPLRVWTLSSDSGSRGAVMRTNFKGCMISSMLSAINANFLHYYTHCLSCGNLYVVLLGTEHLVNYFTHELLFLFSNSNSTTTVWVIVNGFMLLMHDSHMTSCRSCWISLGAGFINLHSRRALTQKV